jgi:hypothetical protein
MKLNKRGGWNKGKTYKIKDRPLFSYLDYLEKASIRKKSKFYKDYLEKHRRSLTLASKGL